MTLTTERLREIAEDGFLEHGDAKLMARELLANREAQPVAWTDAQELRDVEKVGVGYLFKVEPITPYADPRRVIKLYTAPPAPAVPDALANDIDSDDHPLLWSYNNGWNACLAAMLKGERS